MKIQLLVTQDDIDKGIKKNSERCPIALALRKLYPNARDVTVSDTEIILDLMDMSLDTGYHPSLRYWEVVPDQSLELFINDFDNWVKVEPATFSLDFFIDFS